MPSSRRGRPPHDDLLTPAEWRTVDAVRHGLGNARIAKLRGVSVDAVKYHVANAIAKLGLADRRALRHWRGAQKHSPARTGETDMTAPAQIESIHQIARTVADIQAAQRWYSEVLGLRHLYTFDKLCFFDCGGVRLYLQESATPAPESILYLRVGDIQQTHAALTSRGVQFRGAPHMVHRHADGTEEWLAIFDDPEGRPLAIMAQARPGPGSG